MILSFLIPSTRNEVKPMHKRTLIFLFCLAALLTLLTASSALAGGTQYGQINHDQVRFRRQIDSTDVWAMLDAGWQVEILSSQRWEGTTYYYVTCGTPKNPDRQYWGYVSAEYVNLLSAAPATEQTVYAPAVTAAPVYSSADSTAGTSAAPAAIRFTAQGVNLRKTPSAYAKVLGQFQQDEVVACTGTLTAEGILWYQVSTGTAQGYVMAKYAAPADGSASAAVPAVPVPPQTGYTAAEPQYVYVTAVPQTVYATAAPQSAADGALGAIRFTARGVNLRKTPSLNAKVLGQFSKGEVIPYYGTVSSEGAVWYQVRTASAQGYVMAKFAEIADGTAASSSAASSAAAAGTVLYMPELADWYSSGIQSIFYKGCVATVTDVKTGISFQVKRWSGGSHADVEPLTASDTAAICRMYGVSSAEEIITKNLYQRRSILVTVSGHSYAASMYGVPHNATEGDTIKDNNYTGQFCIHFTNSKTHGSSQVDSDHQAAIQYAYTNGVTQLSSLGYSFQ